jgi:mycobactin lysine-N-oxygenase
MATARRKSIAVIGGGPKAVALAAKAFALRIARIRDVQVTIFERQCIGANWSGKFGYTDGKQRLCTPAERDVGFPYSSMGGEQVDATMYSSFSWQSFLLSESQAYSQWVDYGSRPPTHADFARYLEWVVQRTGTKPVFEEVSKLVPHKAGWIVHSSPSGKRARAHETVFDALVVSSPGPARKLSVRGKSSKIFNGEDFWSRLKEVEKAANKRDPSQQIVIVGAGGTAAAALSWLVRHGYENHEIVLVANQAALFTRGDSVFENRLFSDETRWQALSKSSRQQFFDRLNRGVVWSTVMNEVSQASNLQFLDGRAEQVRVDSRGDVSVTVRRDDDDNRELRASLLLDASGFDNWWFLRLIDGLPADKLVNRKYLEKLRDSMSPDLSFQRPAWKYPPLHAPAHSSLIGPGLGSLMTLGGMSDRILSAYT